MTSQVHLVDLVPDDRPEVFDGRQVWDVARSYTLRPKVRERYGRGQDVTRAKVSSIMGHPVVKTIVTYKHSSYYSNILNVLATLRITLNPQSVLNCFPTILKCISNILNWFSIVLIWSSAVLNWTSVVLTRSST